MECDYLFKIVLIGDSGVGKTNIMTRFSRNSFSQTSKATIGVDFASRNVSIDDKYIKIQIWDTAGQERYRAITSSYYRNSSGIMLVYDITNEDTFINCDKWLKELKNNAGIDVPIILIGNKSDILYQREVDTDKALEFAKNNNLMFIETSARDGKNIDDAFSNLAEYIYNTNIKVNTQTTDEINATDILLYTGPSTEVTHIDEEIKVAKKKSCC